MKLGPARLQLKAFICYFSVHANLRHAVELSTQEKFLDGNVGAARFRCRYGVGTAL